jgi:hypothetical protein
LQENDECNITFCQKCKKCVFGHWCSKNAKNEFLEAELKEIGEG